MDDHPVRTQQQIPTTDALKISLPENGPSGSQLVAVVTLLPICGTLLFLSGLTFVGTLIGLAVSTPLFVIFSPVLIPAALVIGLGVTGFLTSGAFGITAISSITWLANYILRMRVSTSTSDIISDHAKQRLKDATDYVGQKTKDAGQTVQDKAHETTGPIQENITDKSNKGAITNKNKTKQTE